VPKQTKTENDPTTPLTGLAAEFPEFEFVEGRKSMDESMWNSPKTPNESGDLTDEKLSKESPPPTPVRKYTWPNRGLFPMIQGNIPHFF
jgi:hypothetical protein